MQFSRNPVISLVSVICVILLLTSALAWPVAAYAAARVELMSPAVIEAKPRAMLSAGIRVTNDGAASATYQVASEAPPGWQCSTFPDTVEIGPGGSEVVFLTINQPAGASTGDYVIVVKCYPSGMPSDAASVELTVRVPGVLLFDIRPNRLEQEAAFSGDKIEQTFTVTNTGNIRAQVALDIKGSPDWPATVTPPDRRLDLEPDQSANVVVSTTIPDKLVQSETYRLTVIARPVEPVAAGMEWKASTSTRVIPRELSTASNYATLDGDIEVQTSWRDNDGSSTIFSINTLESEIAEGRRLTLGPINILVGGHATGGLGQGRSITGGYEDAELGYIRAGDFSVDMLSPLMGSYMSGRGGDVLYRSGDTDYRAFYSRGRGSIPEENLGIQLAQHIGRDVVMRLTAFRDSELSVPASIEREAETSTNLGLLVGYEPSEDTEVTGEIGRSNVSGSGSDNAWRLNANYKQERFSASGEWLRAGNDFRGGWRDTELRRAYLSWGPLEDLNLWANYNWARFNLDSDPDREGRNNRDLAIGASWNIEDFGQLRVSHRIDNTRDVILNESNSKRNTTEYSFSRDWDIFRVSASWENSAENDSITGDNKTDRLLRLDCSARLNRKASLRFGYSTGRTSEDHGAESTRDSNISFGGDFTIGRNLNASFSLQRTMGELNRNRTSLNGSLGWELSNGSRFNLEGRGFTGDGNSDTEFALRFTYPVSFPLRMFPRKGSMEGRVFHADDPSRGMPNVGISVDNIEMVTDDNGHFIFPSLDPGDHQLTLDTATLGVGMTPEPEFPLVFIVEAGSTTKLEIPVRESVAIGGQVFLETPGSRGAPPSRQPLEKVVVELKTEGGSSYRVTDSTGQFLYTDLLPGKYVVTLRSERLPQWHQVKEPTTYELELGPGESRRDLVFIVVPVERGIEITTESPGS